MNKGLLVYDALSGNVFSEGRFGQTVKNIGNGDQGAIFTFHRDVLFGEPFSNEEISNHHRFYQQLTNSEYPLRPTIDPKIDGEINLLITQNWNNEEVTAEGEAVNGRGYDRHRQISG